VTARFVKGVVFGALASGVLLVSGAALAGTGIGGVFNLGKTNTVNASTVLTGSTSGGLLNVRNASTAAQAAGIVIHTENGKSPLVLNSTTKVKNLNADTLDGVDSAALQRRVASSCPRSAITGVGPAGGVDCAPFAVVGIHALPAASSQSTLDLAPWGPSLELFFVCHNGGSTVSAVDFGNGSTTHGATLNWIYSTGGAASTVNASGTSLPPAPGSQQTVLFGGNRIEGQFIWSEPGFVVTVNLHAFDGGTSCEINGTAEIAAVS
jgi:hypothetical protein